MSSSRQVGHESNVRASYRTVLLLALIVAAAIGLRGILVISTDHSHLLRADAYEYYRYALNLKHCGVYSPSVESILTECEQTPVADNHRPPGFPLLILPFAEWPPTLAMMRDIQWVQVTLGAFCVVLTFLTFRKLGQGIAFGSAILVAISPHMVVASLNFLTENLFSLTLVVFLLTCARWNDKPTLPRATAIGIALALPLLVRPTTVFLILGVVPFCLWSTKKQRAKTAVAILGAFCLCFGPWYAISNFILPDRNVPSLALMSIHNGTYVDLTVGGDPNLRGEPHNHDPTFKERDTLPKVVSYLFKRVSEDPYTYIRWYLIGKPIMYFRWDVVAGFGDVFVYPVEYHGYSSNYWLHLSHLLMWNLHWTLTAFAVIGCVLAWLPKRFVSNRNETTVFISRIAALIIAYFIAAHIVGTPLPRYAVPIRPLMFALACWSAATLFTSARNLLLR